MSLTMTPFDGLYATFYWSALVNITLCCTIFEFINVEYYPELELWVRGHSRSLKLAPIKSLDALSYSPSIVTTAVYVAVCEIFSVKEGCDLKNKSGFVQGHWKWHHLIDRIRVPIRLPY